MKLNSYTWKLKNIAVLLGGVLLHLFGMPSKAAKPGRTKPGVHAFSGRITDTTKAKAGFENPPVLDTSFNRINTKLILAAERMKEKTAGLDQYLTLNGLNTDFCFLVDMSIPSGKNRFYIYDVNKKEVIQSALVSHGSGSYKPGCDDVLEFSNMPSSNATSLGRYRIGAGYTGKYGPAFKLYGLDESNSNAFARAIVLHADRYVPEKEPFPRHIFESMGCPVLSPSMLNTASQYIKSSKKPVLLWIYK